MSSDLAIRVEGLGKAYTIRHQQSDHVTLAQVALERAKHPFRRHERERFWALQDVSFEVRQGEVLGLIGRNGAGKSTLLKLLTRITGPTTGRVEMWGRVGSLLEVGTGFHPELTGRENVYLNGSILGMRRREIDRQFDAIVDFAGVEKFLDTPVKRYSSGMYVRLAFAVAAHLETEILLLDEVLAVGDADFQARCLGKVNDIAASGRTVMLVSHNMGTITSFAHRAVLLSDGRFVNEGTTDAIVAEYAERRHSVLVDADVEDQPRYDKSFGSRAKIIGVRLNHQSGIVAAHDDLSVTLFVRSHESFTGVQVSQTTHSVEGTAVGSSHGSPVASLVANRTTALDVVIPKHRLAPGQYFLTVSIKVYEGVGGGTDLDVVLDTVHFEVAPEIGEGGVVKKWERPWGFVRFPAPVVVGESLT